MKGPFSFGKNERLSHRTAIESLFNQGESFNLAPFRIIYQLTGTSEDSPVKVLITIPKRKFRRAIDRNRLRRKIREAYRLNRQPLIDKAGMTTCSIHIAFIYTADRTNMPFAEIEKSVIRCLERLAGRIAAG